MNRSRAELKGFFKKNAIPTQSNFEDLIDSGFNQNDDGLVKLPNDPLTVNAAGTEESLLRFSRVDAAGSKPVWLVKQNPTGASPTAGLLFQDAASGANALFLQNGSGGHVGVGTLTPAAKLDVAGLGGTNVDLNVSGRLRSNNDDGGLWVSDDRFVGGADGIVGFKYDDQWRLVVDGNGNVGIGTTTPAARLSITEPTGTAASANAGSLLFEHGNSGGASSIVFRSAVNAGSDYGYIQYQDSTGVGAAGESARLIMGINNDANDHVVLMPSGNVGIGTMNPTVKLEIAGGGGGNVDLQVSGRIRSNSNDGGMWIAQDRFVGGFSNQMGFWINNAWRFTLGPDGTASIPNGRLVLGAWTIAAEGNHLFIRYGSFTIARFAYAFDRLNVFQNANGLGPYFFVNASGTSGMYTPATLPPQ